MAARPGRQVWSSERGGSVCPRCGWPARDCRCAKNLESDEAVPERITAKLRIEKGGRGGKTVTVIDGLPRNREFLAGLAADLKRACGAGGTAGDGAVEVQGDHRATVAALLRARGFTVKGA